MAQYSIRDLEQLSGIKAHTIRIWEKRHQLISPQRTDTNIRLYSDEDLKRIINISLLNTRGFKISKIASMSDGEIHQQVTLLSEQHEEAEIHIDQLIIAMVELDEEKFEKILLTLILRYKLERTITEIIYPFMEKIGVLWQTGNILPAQEHFIANLIRQKLIVAIDAIPFPPASAHRLMLFLPEKEQHEIALLFFHYIAKKEGYRTYYLGQSVPFDDLVSVYNTHHPSVMITNITYMPSVQLYLDKLSEHFPECKILVSGFALRKKSLQYGPQVQFFDKSLELKDLLSIPS
ncbi:MAG: MerR family transcriptional regulator [Cyclobacteriaceae bacterium]|nr:MerR family transcriptional regulator [Cyclobacteriaceae bacterium]